MRVTHTLAYLGKDKGGIAAAIPPLLEACSNHGPSTEIVSQTWPEEESVELPGNVYSYYVQMATNSKFGYSHELRRVLRQRLVCGADLIHSHNLWMYINYLSAELASSLKKPHLITPHGALEPWALAHSARKKKLARFLFQDRGLKKAACVHALSLPEAVNIRALGVETPIAVIPNGVDLTAYSSLPVRTALVDRFPQLADQKLILFLGRIHPKKGLIHLIEAWGRLARRFPEWHLVIAGPDEVSHRASLERMTRSLDVSSRISFIGMVAGDDKVEVLSACDIFVLPSFSEGFSMAVLEAMACKLPILLTSTCNFHEAAEVGAAVEVSPEAQSVQQGLGSLLEMTDREREEMGMRGNSLVAGKYSWKHVAKELTQVYKWCLGGGVAPSSVKML